MCGGGGGIRLQRFSVSHGPTTGYGLLNNSANISLAHQAVAVC